jgi:hypothetical protein
MLDELEKLNPSLPIYNYNSCGQSARHPFFPFLHLRWYYLYYLAGDACIILDIAKPVITPLSLKNSSHFSLTHNYNNQKLRIHQNHVQNTHKE